MCTLGERGRHEIVIRLRADNFVQFQNTCDPTIADAAERLCGGMTCYGLVKRLKTAILSGGDVDATVVVCSACPHPVAVHDGRIWCPFHPHLVLLAAPFWNRIMRAGRVSKPHQKKRIGT
jgi:hypothetical protein